MQEEAPQEFIGRQGHGSSLVAMSVVSPTEGDFTVGHGQESRVGDGNAVSIAREIGEDLRGTGKGSLGINDPVAMCGGA
jgi:hypothetical protein